MRLENAVIEEIYCAHADRNTGQQLIFRASKHYHKSILIFEEERLSTLSKVAITKDQVKQAAELLICKLFCSRF